MPTDTDPVDEIEVPHLRQRLWEELAELHAGRTATATRDAGVELVQRRVHRSRRRAAIGAAAAAVLVAGVFAVQLVGSNADPPAGRSADVLVARVAAATDEALAESVVHSVDDQVSSDGTPSTWEMWHDETTGIARFVERDAQGNPIHDVGPLVGPTVESPDYSGQRFVDYCRQGYFENPDTGSASTNVGAGVVDVRELVAEGEMVEDGTEVVEGRELIRLRGTDSEGGSFVILVDPNTYRVVGQRGTFSADGIGGTYSMVYEYLPRTAESLELLHPPIPDGFTLIDPETRLPEDPCGDA